MSISGILPDSIHCTADGHVFRDCAILPPVPVKSFMAADMGSLIINLNVVFFVADTHLFPKILIGYGIVLEIYGDMIFCTATGFRCEQIHKNIWKASAGTVVLLPRTQNADALTV